jgi:phospholipid/cholesterol/gamma-HCH transport system substrate-binding protein
METRAHHLLIGLFTVFALSAALAFALWLGSTGNDQQSVYDVIFDEAITGLSKGSAVELKGIRIGTVADLRLYPLDPSRVRARIHVDSTVPIYSDTRARLNTAAITGLSTIRLSTGGGTALHPKDGDIPIIKTEPSSFSKLLDSGEDVIVSTSAVLGRIQQLLSDRNLDNLSRSLENFEHTMAALSAERDDVHQTLSQLARASEQTNALLTETTQLVHTANRLLDGQGQSALDSAQRSMATLERTMSSIDKLLADNRTPLNASLSALSDLGPAVTELRATLASLRTIARRLEERPADYLLGLEPTKEFKP